MKESLRHGLLSFIAVAAINIFILPAVFLIRALIFGYSGGLLHAVLFTAVTVAGYVAGRMIFREEADFFKTAARLPVLKFLFYIFNVKEKSRLLSGTGGYISILLPLIAAAALFGGKGILRLLFEMLFLVLPYIIALKNSGKSYSEILYNQIAFFGFFLMAAALIAVNYIDSAKHLKWYFYAILYIYILVYLILRNQEDIDTNIFSKKYIQKSILPRNMRGFNFLAVLWLYAIILILFNLKTITMHLINISIKIVGWVVFAVLWIISFLFPMEGGAPQQGGQAPADFGFAGGAEEVVNPLSNLIGNTLKTFVLLYILYKLLPLLFKAAVKLASKLAGLLKRRFGQRASAVSIDEYDDEVEIIKPEKEAKTKRKLNKGINEAKRELAKITDPVMRVRHMYGILLKMLDVYGVGLQKSDTTSEIYNKAKAVGNFKEPFGPVTSLYNEVRYAGAVPDPNSLSTYEIRYEEASGIINECEKSH